MVMHLTYSLYLLPAFLYGTVIEYQSPDLITVCSNPARKTQILLCIQNQDRTPTDILIAQQIIIRVLTTFSLCLFPILSGKVTVDVPVSVKQHDQKSSHNHGNIYTALFD